MNKYFISVGVVWVVLSLIIGLIIVLNPLVDERAAPVQQSTGYVAPVAQKSVQEVKGDDTVVSKVRISDGNLTDEEAERSDFVRSQVQIKR